MDVTKPYKFIRFVATLDKGIEPLVVMAEDVATNWAYSTYLRLEYVIKNIICILVFGRFPAELGPETRSNGSGSKNGAERSHNQPKRPIMRPFRDHVLVRTHN